MRPPGAPRRDGHPRRRRPLRAAAVLLAVAVAPAAAQDLAFRHYGAEAGVPRAYAVAFDGAGQLLAGVNDGLVRFDGRAFNAVALPVEGAVWRLAPGAGGAVWALTDRGALARLGLDGRSEAVPPPAAIRDRLREAAWRTRIRADGRGRLWLSVGDGTLYRWEGERRVWTAHRVPGTDRVGDFFFRADGGGTTLVVAADRGVGEAPVRAGRLGAPRWTATAERLWWVRPHPGARAWVGGARGVYLLDRGGGLRRVSAPGLAPWPHNEPGVDAAGRLAVLLEGDGPLAVARFAPDGALELTTQGDRSLPVLLSNHLAFDPEGALWVAHQNGLATLQDEWIASVPLRTADGHDATVFGLAADAGGLWVSTYGGMFRIEGGRATPLAPTSEWMAFPPVLVRDGAAWVEGRGDHTRAELRSRRSDGTARARPLVVHEGPGGRVETDEGGTWRRRSGRRVRLGPAFLPGARGVEDAAGRVWIAGDPGRLDVVWGDSLGSACAACLPPTLRAALAALDRRPAWTTLAADRHGRVWAAGLPGLAALWERPDGTWAHRLFGPDDGLLARNAAVALSPDGRRLWVGTPLGVQGFQVRPGMPALEAFAELRARDGLPGETVSALAEDEAGMLWAALRPGFIERIDWRAVAVPPPSPAVRVVRAQVDGHDVALAAGYRLREGDGLTLGLWPRTYRRPERVRIEYRLGPEAPWASLGTGRQLALASVPAGRHALEVRAVRPGRPPGPPARLGLDVAAPFWRTWPFVAILAVAAAGALGAVHRVREGRRQATEALRQRIAADLHDELGGGLTQVSLYAELIRRAAAEDPRVAGWADHVGAQARALSESMRDVVWAIRGGDAGWDDLELRIKDAAVALLSPLGIAPDLGGEVVGRPPPLSPEVRQNVLLFVKEALHNAVRHAAPTRIEVRWRLTRRALAVRVCDDGRGFDPATAAPGVGLASLRRRAAALGGTLEVTSAPGAGACLALEVPLSGRREPTRSGR